MLKLERARGGGGGGEREGIGIGGEGAEVVYKRSLRAAAETDRERSMHRSVGIYLPSPTPHLHK
jgi:hypothetical protein